MYTWGYLKEAILAKLDLDTNEAETLGLVSRFHIYANEAITQICSTVKPKYTFATFVVKDFDCELAEGEVRVGTATKMPSDFVSFGDDVNHVTFVDAYGETVTKTLFDHDEFSYIGTNSILFKRPGIYTISYNARWCLFNTEPDGDEEIDAPLDVLDCIPSYVASQCMKIDDDYKASVFRNEYETFLARIDNTNYRNTKTFMIEGDW